MNDSDRKTPSARENTEAVWDQYINEPAPAPPGEDESEDSAVRVTGNGSHGAGTPKPEKERREADFPDLASENIIDPVFLKLEDIQNQLQKLDSDFQAKLKYDEHKNKLIDDLHRELQSHKDDILKRFLRSLVMDLIQFIDSIRKLTDHYATLDPNHIDPDKILQLLKSIPSDLEDICGRQGVMPFTCDGGCFNPSRQRVLKQVETRDPAKDKMVAESLRPGYEWDDQMIRPEMVAVYTFIAPAKPDDTLMETDTPIQPDEPPAETDAREIDE